MNPIKAIIVDDEPNARKALRGMLNEQFEEVLVLADCGNVPEAVKMINRFKPDLIFLDIDMQPVLFVIVPLYRNQIFPARINSFRFNDAGNIWFRYNGTITKRTGCI